jgi:hypothetical protein
LIPWVVPVALSILSPSSHRYRQHDPAGDNAASDGWFLAFDLLGQANTGISSLELSRRWL